MMSCAPLAEAMLPERIVCLKFDISCKHFRGCRVASRSSCSATSLGQPCYPFSPNPVESIPDPSQTSLSDVQPDNLTYSFCPVRSAPNKSRRLSTAYHPRRSLYTPNDCRNPQSVEILTCLLGLVPPTRAVMPSSIWTGQIKTLQRTWRIACACLLFCLSRL